MSFSRQRHGCHGDQILPLPQDTTTPTHASSTSPPLFPSPHLIIRRSSPWDAGMEEGVYSTTTTAFVSDFIQQTQTGYSSTPHPPLPVCLLLLATSSHPFPSSLPLSDPLWQDFPSKAAEEEEVECACALWKAVISSLMRLLLQEWGYRSEDCSCSCCRLQLSDHCEWTVVDESSAE